jgi:hypothetical protein
MKPLFNAPLLPIVDAYLAELLRSLTPAEWQAQTVAPAWKVKDVAAHLLDTQLRKLSLVREGYVAGPPPRFESNDEFVALINQLNRDGVAVYRRLSPAVLIAIISIAKATAGCRWRSHGAGRLQKRLFHRGSRGEFSRRVSTGNLHCRKRRLPAIATSAHTS